MVGMCVMNGCVCGEWWCVWMIGVCDEWLWCVW